MATHTYARTITVRPDVPTPLKQEQWGQQRGTHTATMTNIHTCEGQRIPHPTLPAFPPVWTRFLEQSCHCRPLPATSLPVLPNAIPTFPIQPKQAGQGVVAVWNTHYPRPVVLRRHQSAITFPTMVSFVQMTTTVIALPPLAHDDARAVRGRALRTLPVLAALRSRRPQPMQGPTTGGRPEMALVTAPQHSRQLDVRCQGSRSLECWHS